MDLTKRNDNHIIPSHCHLPVGSRSVVDLYTRNSIGSCKVDFFHSLFANRITHNDEMKFRTCNYSGISCPIALLNLSSYRTFTTIEQRQFLFFEDLICTERRRSLEFSKLLIY